MMSNQHVLKIHPAPLADLLSGAKIAEVRRNDRGFQVGDTVRLMEVNPETGNWTGADDHVRTISHIQTGYGLPDGMCVLSYAQAEQQEAREPAAAEVIDSLTHPLCLISLRGDDRQKALANDLAKIIRQYQGADQEAQGAQAGDLSRPKDPSEYRGLNGIYAKGWNDCLAALSTQSAAQEVK